MFDERQLSFPLSDDSGAIQPPKSPTSPFGVERYVGEALFLALLPPAPLATRIAEFADDLKGQFRLSGNKRPAHTLHVSLFCFGRFEEIPDELVQTLKDKMARVLFAPFVVEFDKIMSFRVPDRYAIVMVGSESNLMLDALCGTIASELGLPPRILRDIRVIRSHVTLLYDKRPIVTALAQPFRWTAESFVLIRSFQRESRYEELGSWSVADLPILQFPPDQDD